MARVLLATISAMGAMVLVGGALLFSLLLQPSVGVGPIRLELLKG